MRRPSAIEATAYHEAGHAVIALHNKIRFKESTIRRIGTNHGALIPVDSWPKRTQQQREGTIQMCLAGSIAQRHHRASSWRRHHGADDLLLAYGLLSKSQNRQQRDNEFRRLMKK